MTKEVRRRFSREFKLCVVERMLAGESGTALSREVSVKREVLYRWRDRFLEGGALALRSQVGRPPKAEALELVRARGVASKANDLTQARRQIADLERKVGRQQLDLDFFKQALRQVAALELNEDGSGATASSPASK